MIISVVIFWASYYSFLHEQSGRDMYINKATSKEKNPVGKKRTLTMPCKGTQRSQLNSTDPV